MHVNQLAKDHPAKHETNGENSFGDEHTPPSTDTVFGFDSIVFFLFFLIRYLCFAQNRCVRREGVAQLFRVIHIHTLHLHHHHRSTHGRAHTQNPNLFIYILRFWHLAHKNNFDFRFAQNKKQTNKWANEQWTNREFGWLTSMGRTRPHTHQLEYSWIASEILLIDGAGYIRATSIVLQQSTSMMATKRLGSWHFRFLFFCSFSIPIGQSTSRLASHTLTHRTPHTESGARWCTTRSFHLCAPSVRHTIAFRACKH